MIAAHLPPSVPVNATIAGQPMVIICSWHTPVPELLALGRQYPGRVSHALCEACAARFEQAVA